MNIRSLYTALCERYPEAHRAAFDFDGLQLCPDESREVRRVFLALDVTRESVQAACDFGADLLLTHHPILFSPVRTLDPASSMDAQNATRLLTHGIAHISLHTRFDAGVGGINDSLAELFELTDVQGFAAEEDPIALGRIGNCKPLSPKEFAADISRRLNTHVLLTEGKGPVTRVAVVGGGAGDYLEAFLQSDAQMLVTGEIAHHRRLLCAHADKSVVEAGHWGSEVIFCSSAKKVLLSLDAGLETDCLTATPHEICIIG